VNSITEGAGCVLCSDCGRAVNILTSVNTGVVCCPTKYVCNECLLKYCEEEKMSDGISDAFKFVGQYGDSITVEEFKKKQLTEGTKHDNGKPTTSLLPSKPLLEIAKVLDFGAKKYDAHNWRKGIKYSRVLSAAQRHLMAWNDGQTIDPETGITHLAHAACNLLFLLEYELSGKIEFDDRHKGEDK
jgi:hypothetical protein